MIVTVFIIAIASNDKITCIISVFPDFSAVLQRPKRDAYNYDGTKTIFRETPYGGRYEIHLKNNTKMYVHLKDKKQIRHKKRWSQVRGGKCFPFNKLKDEYRLVSP